MSSSGASGVGESTKDLLASVSTQPSKPSVLSSGSSGVGESTKDLLAFMSIQPSKPSVSSSGTSGVGESTKDLLASVSIQPSKPSVSSWSIIANTFSSVSVASGIIVAYQQPIHTARHFPFVILHFYPAGPISPFLFHF